MRLCERSPSAAVNALKAQGAGVTEDCLAVSFQVLAEAECLAQVALATHLTLFAEGDVAVAPG